MQHASLQRCTRCVLTSAYPKTRFDAEGVCSYCREFERRWRNWRPLPEREHELAAILEKASKSCRRYPALVGLSGGKDSSYLLHTMVRKFHVEPLCYTVDTGFLSEEARSNIDLMVSQLSVDHRYVTIEDGLLQRLYKGLFANRCTDFCMVCSNISLSATNRLALEEKIPVVVWGLSPRTEPIMPLELLNPYDYRYMAALTRSHVSHAELYSNFRYVDLPWLFYLLFIKRLQHVFLPEYVAWDEAEIFELLVREYGWHDYGEGRPHFDCVASRAVNHFAYQRLGISRNAEKLSQLVRSGQMSRDEALQRLGENGDKVEPVEAVTEVCRRLGATREELGYLLDGSGFDYRNFPGYSRWLRRLSWMLGIGCKLRLLSETFYQKYRL